MQQMNKDPDRTMTSPFHPNPPLALEFMPGGRMSMADLAMQHSQHIAHTYNLAAVVIIVQAHDGETQTAGYTMGMGDPMRATHHLMHLLQHAKVRWGSFLLKNGEMVGNG